MIQLAHGSVGERPWGCALASFAGRRLGGELAVGVGDKQQVRAVLHDGAIVAAASPLAADSAARIGMTMNMVTSTQVVELSRRLAAAPDRDDVEVIAEALRLAPELAQRLRRRVVALRAARTFGLDGAPYVLDDRVRVAVVDGCAVDTRAVIYLGARTHLTTDQLASAVEFLGSTVAFTQELIDDLPQFGFGELEMPVVTLLRRGEPFSALLSGRSEAERRLAYAVMYALLVWTRPDAALSNAANPADPQDLGGLSVSFRKRPTSLPPDRSAVGSPRTTISPTPTPPIPRTATADRSPSVNGRSPSVNGTIPPTSLPSSSPLSPQRTTGSHPTISSPAPTPTPTPTLTPSPSPTPPPRRITGNPTLQPSADSKLTTSPPVATAEQQQQPPPQPPQPQPRNPSTTASQLIARATGRFGAVQPSATGSSPGIGPASPESPPSADQVRADAEAARQRGEMALRRELLAQAIEEFQTATRLDPKNGAYSALLAWSQFCVASDKAAVANDVRRVLLRSIQATPEPVARLYLGRVERMLGREREALAQFREVLQLHPGHVEATSEARVLEGRLANKSSGGFGRSKR